jgi:NAD(P)-dependent dehydrogenase (short-subunit alcohol dehydrogenase family)
MSHLISGPLDGRVAIVTGASRGIGLAVANRLLESGASVLLGARGLDALERATSDLAAAHGAGRVAHAELDVCVRASVDAFVATAVERFGTLDIAVANAGSDHGAPFLQLDETSWEQVVQTNLSGAFRTTQAAARAMVGHAGRIVLVSSTNAFFPESNLASYNAAKAGVVGLMRAAAIELAPYGITVNAVGPGLVHTEMTEALVLHPDHGRRYLEHIPIGRFGTPADIAAAIAYLASDDAGWVTGHHLVVDGGQTIGVDLPLETVDGDR